MTDKCLNPLSERSVALILVFVFAVSVGCDSKPQLVPVSGNVSVAGKPLAAGRIFFEPVGGGDDVMSAVGDIRDGEFQLYTYKPGDGVIPGSYYPVVMDPKEEDGASTKKGQRVGVVQLSKMNCDVTVAGANTFDIEITSEDLKWAVDDD